MKVLERFILALDMHFRNRDQGSGIRSQEKVKLLSCILYLASFIFLSLGDYCHAEVLERIVAIVNDDVILLSELEEAFQTAKKSDKGVTRDLVLDEMIDKALLLEQAKRFRLGKSAAHQRPVNNKKLVDEYIERRIRALIHTPFRDIESYYMSNMKQFNNKDFYEVKDEIESYLVEKELEKKLLGHIDELRKSSYIRIQLETEE